MNPTQHAANDYSLMMTRHDGSTEEVKFRLPSLRDLEAYMTATSNDVVTAEMLAGKEPGWADQWTDASVYALCGAAEELMRPRIAAWMDRQAAKAMAAKPLVDRQREMSEKLGMKR